MDGKEPQAIRPQRTTISERSGRRRMGACGAVDPPARRVGNKRHVDVREVMNGIMYVLSTSASGGLFRKICRHAARFSTILICGATTARSIASITPYIWSAASKANARPVPPPPSSTAEA